jgi:hypothetical protein
MRNNDWIITAGYGLMIATSIKVIPFYAGALYYYFSRKPGAAPADMPQQPEAPAKIEPPAAAPAP